MIVELVSLIPSLLIVQLFKCLKPRHPQVSLLRQTLSQMTQQSTISVNTTKEIDSEKKKQLKFTLPWWFIFIAYSLSLLLILLSIFIIIVRGIEVGDLKTQQWLTSILTGFCSGILFTQPIKV